MAVRAVFFDVGETLVDEERYWRAVARLAGIGPHVLWAALGVTIARGEEHGELWRHLRLEQPALAEELSYRTEDLYPDAVDCLAAMHTGGLLVGVVGNQTLAMERWAREQSLPADLIASSASWGVRKPEGAFFERIVSEVGCAADEIAYVGDRVDNDVIPAIAAGLRARRGPWGMLQTCAGTGAPCIGSLAELPAALASIP